MSMTQEQINVDLFDQCKRLQAENANYKEREKLCESIDEAEKLALIRALQEIRDSVGLIGDGVSPKDIVEKTKELAQLRAKAEAWDKGQLAWGIYQDTTFCFAERSKETAIVRIERITTRAWEHLNGVVGYTVRPVIIFERDEE